MKNIIDSETRRDLLENYVERFVLDLSSEEIRNLLIDYIYDEKSRMTNVALIAEINDTYPDLLVDWNTTLINRFDPTSLISRGCGESCVWYTRSEERRNCGNFYNNLNYSSLFMFY